MDHSEELAGIGGVLEDIARSLAIIAADVEEKRHARHIMEREEYERLSIHLEDRINKAEAAGGESYGEQLWDIAKETANILDRHVEMYPHLKDDQS